MTTLLRTDRLHAGYGKIVAVRDLDIGIEEGEIVALLGANGAGKSTTLGAIAVFASTTNVVSGFLITDRMLKMFRRREPAPSPTGDGKAS